MPESLRAVEADLRRKFSEVFQKSTHFQTYVRIGSFLSDPSQYLKSLLVLDVELGKVFLTRLEEIKQAISKKEKEEFESEALLDLLQGIRQERHKKNPQIAREVNPYEGYARALYSKLLSSVLFQWEKENGFVLDPSGKVDILMGIPTGLFNAQLKAGRPFKDLGAGKEHGEYSHRIQMFMIGVGLKLPNTGDIYRNVANYITVKEQPSLSGPSSAKRYLWEYLFDRDGMPSNANTVAFKAVDKFDFRAPSNLNRRLMKEKLGLPFLGWCLRDRFEKRSATEVDWTYVEKKVPGNEEARQLGDAQRAALRGDISNFTLVQRAYQGLFIRRGKEVVEINWQAQA